MKKSKLLKLVSEKILKINSQKPLLIGINGVDGSGKTYFAKELENYLCNIINRQIINISIDDFHNPREIRYQKGENSSIGYYEDSFNLKAFIEFVFKPIVEGKTKIKTKYFYHFTDKELNEPFTSINKNAIIIIEGIFLFKKELVDYFDFKIFIDVDFKFTVARAIARDKKKKETQQEKNLVNEKYLKRYVPGQKLYLEDVKPKELADFVFDNTDFEEPIVKKNVLLKYNRK